MIFFKNILKLFLFTLFLSIAITSKADETSDIKKYEDIVENMLSQVYADLPSKKTTTEVFEYFSNNTINNFAISYMSKWALGNYFREISNDKELLDKYYKATRDYMVISYGGIFTKYYQSYTFTINGGEKQGNDYLVNVVVKIRPDAKVRPTNAKDNQISSVWKLSYSKSENKYLIKDINISGISLLNAQKSEFTSLVSQSGSVKAFVDALENKVNSMKQAQGILSNL